MEVATDIALKWIKGGKEYFDLLLELIKNAKSSVHLHTYLLDDDNTGMSVINALNDASQRGVYVQVLVDSFGSNSLDRSVIAELKENNVHFRKFSPNIIGKQLQIGRRLHYKVLLIDDDQFVIGGINCADKYHGSPSEPAWLDYAVHVKNQKLANSILNICTYFWESNIFPSSRDQTLPVRIENGYYDILRHDWLKRNAEILPAIIDAINNSKSSIILTGTYFLPDRPVKKALREAALRGVDIKIIFSHKSDIWLAKKSSRYLYDWLLTNDIDLYEWKDSVLHAKCMVVDKKWCTIGSYNINPLSKFGGIELNFVAEDREFSESFHDHLTNDIIANCLDVDLNIYERQYKIRRFSDRLAYYVVIGIFRFIKMFDEL